MLLLVQFLPCFSAFSSFTCFSFDSFVFLSEVASPLHSLKTFVVVAVENDAFLFRRCGFAVYCSLLYNFFYRCSVRIGLFASNTRTSSNTRIWLIVEDVLFLLFSLFLFLFLVEVVMVLVMIFVVF